MTERADQLVDAPPIVLLAELRPPTLNAEKRTVEVVFYTGAPIERVDWSSGVTATS